MTEPTSTAIALLVTAALFAPSAFLSRTSVRVGLPFSLLFRAIGSEREISGQLIFGNQEAT